MVGPKIFDKFGLVQESHGKSMTIASETFGRIFGSIYLMNWPIISFFRMKSFSREELTTVGWIGGAALMIRHELFKKIGGLDSHFFYCAGDMVDLCARAKGAGYKSVFVPQATLLHKGGVSAGSNRNEALWRSIEGCLYFFKKHQGHGVYLFMKTVYFIMSIIKAVISSVVSIFAGKKFWEIAKSYFVLGYRLLFKL